MAKRIPSAEHYYTDNKCTDNKTPTSLLHLRCTLPVCKQLTTSVYNNPAHKKQPDLPIKAAKGEWCTFNQKRAGKLFRACLVYSSAKLQANMDEYHTSRYKATIQYANSCTTPGCYCTTRFAYRAALQALARCARLSAFCVSASMTDLTARF